MHDKDTEEIQFMELVRKHEFILKVVAYGYYPQGGYQYKSLLCDLTTYFWQVHRHKPADMSEEEERAWMFVVLRNKARNLVRNEQLHNDLIEYSATLPNVAEESGSPLIERLYELIDMLDRSDRAVLDEYLKQRSIAEIAESLGKSEAYVYRKLSKIRKRLCELNKKTYK